MVRDLEKTLWAAAEQAKLLANDFAVKPYPEDNGNFAIAAER
jgi:hypothetical protein